MRTFLARRATVLGWAILIGLFLLGSFVVHVAGWMALLAALAAGVFVTTMLMAASEK